YVLPSLYEGFGLSPLEAMACGTPVAASKASCIPEICGEENAVFFDPYDVKEMTTKIWELWEDIDLQKELKEKGFKRVKDFSWDKMAKNTLSFYNDVHV
ncbi:MAG: glycosyltransferase, partial [Candidatus Peregrinibacteria bacterium]|nr:glycosyltransferase [Candidatus Peregrinibacteria bacterium]